jgi:hypothetical protein
MDAIYHMNLYICYRTSLRACVENEILYICNNSIWKRDIPFLLTS